MCLLGGSIVLCFLLETDDKLLQVFPGYHPNSYLVSIVLCFLLETDDKLLQVEVVVVTPRTRLTPLTLPTLQTIQTLLTTLLTLLLNPPLTCLQFLDLSQLRIIFSFLVGALTGISNPNPNPNPNPDPDPDPDPNPDPNPTPNPNP